MRRARGFRDLIRQIAAVSLPHRHAAGKPHAQSQRAELGIIFDLAWPIEPALRAAFLRACALELKRYKPEQLGVGLVFRVGKQLQREFFRAPSVHDASFMSKDTR